MVEIPTSYYLSTGEEGGEGGRPPYEAKDGHVVISASGQRDGDRGCCRSPPATRTPRSRAPALYQPRRPGQLAAQKAVERVHGNTVEQIVKALVEAEIPVAPVKTIPQVADDPHLWEREMLVKMPDAVAGEMFVPGATIKMSKTPGRVGQVPTPGEHTDEVLAGILGYDNAKLTELREAKVIG